MTDITLHYPCCLTLNTVHLQVRLGCEPPERAQTQSVEIQVRFYFPSVPACAGDDISAFICYDKVATALQRTVEGREFRLIEFLAMELVKVLKSSLAQQVPGDDVCVWLKVRKVNIPVSFVEHGASFVYSDLPAHASRVEV